MVNGPIMPDGNQAFAGLEPDVFADLEYSRFEGIGIGGNVELVHGTPFVDRE
jgi:hypothetical protein